MLVQACAVRPCASTWLGAGIAYSRLQDYKNAEVALMEANIMNNRQAEVWGYLALLALQTNQAQEAEQALKWALRCELSNAQLLDEIGEQYMNAGRSDFGLVLHSHWACTLLKGSALAVT